MRRSRSTLLAALLAGCLLPGVAQAQAPIVVRALVGRTGRILADTMGATFQVPVGAGRTFAALRAVFADLNVPVAEGDSARLQIGNPGFLKRGSFAGRRMSAWFDCGNNMSGPRADNYRLDIGLIAFVTAAGPDAATLRTAAIGTALDVGEASRPTVACLSSGALERRLHDLVLAKLAG